MVSHAIDCASPGWRLSAPIAQSAGPGPRGRGKAHRWFFVREIHRGPMETPTAELQRAALPQARPASIEPNGSEILVRSLQAEGVKFLWGYPGGAVLYIY